MTKKSYGFVLVSVLLIAVLIAFSIKPSKTNHEGMLSVESATFQLPGGWGYNILVDHKIFIHQETIPAVTGNRTFTSKEDAEKVSNLIIQKLTNKRLPSVTKNDLDSLQVKY